MSNQAHQFYVAETADGSFVAYTTRAPFFCFVEDSEEDALATAERALSLVERSDFTAVHVKSVSRTVTDLRPSKVITREQAYA